MGHNQHSLLDTCDTGSRKDQCQAKACAKVGKPRFLYDNEKQCKWVYYFCDDHLLALLPSDLRFIARAYGCKVN